jgi:endonuclease/exonuclease/phosphatase family metal-dependent hydrolase
LKKIFRKIILYANVVFAVFLILSFLSPHLSPEKIWFPAFLGLAYPYILLVNVFFLLGWILLKRKELLISLLAIVLGWGTFSNYLSIRPFRFTKKGQYENLVREQRKTDHQVKFLSFNVRAFDVYRWEDNPSTSNEIFTFFRDEDPDVLCIQEFRSSNRTGFRESDVFHKLDHMPYRHLGYYVHNPAMSYGIATFSHYPIIHNGSIPLEGRSSICVYSDILMDQDTFRVYNCHLQSANLDSERYQIMDSLKFRYDDQQIAEIKDISFRLRDAFVKRAAQADIIAAHISGCPHPVIICGDFNDTPVSYTYRTIRDGLRDAFSESGWGLGRTYNGKFPSFRIDYILHSGSIDALFFTREKVMLSDHYPIISYLKMKKE